MLDKIKELVKAQSFCVLATVSENKPHCSLMAYIASDDATRFYLISSRSTKKYANCLRNPHVSLLIDDRVAHVGEREKIKALTVEAFCEPMPEGEDRDSVKRRFLERHPHMEKLVNHPDADVLVVGALTFLLLDGVSDSYYERLNR